MIQARQLEAHQSADVQNLVQRCQQYDGASPCVQMEHSLNADQDMDSWFLAYETMNHVPGKLIGLASVFAPSRNEAEISICVDPEYRKHGLGTRLLSLTTDCLRTRGYETVLLVCEQRSVSGVRFAEQHSTCLQHTEYDMRLAMPFNGTPERRLSVTEATLADLADITTVCNSAYGEDDRDFDAYLRHSLSLKNRRGYVGRMDGAVVAACFVGIHEESVSINTVAVSKALQGKGLGREFLSTVIQRLDKNHPVIEISVDSTNAPAYALYRRLGFVDRLVVDYHVL